MYGTYSITYSDSLTLSLRIFGIFRDFGIGFGGRDLGARYWYEPGASRNTWSGFFSVLVTAAFAYSGSEVVGLTAAEQEDPRRDMPRAIKQVFVRIGLVSTLNDFDRTSLI